jgi:hypothetical protein
MILLISASQVTRIIGMSHLSLAIFFFFHSTNIYYEANSVFLYWTLGRHPLISSYHTRRQSPVQLFWSHFCLCHRALLATKPNRLNKLWPQDLSVHTAPLRSAQIPPRYLLDWLDWLTPTFDLDLDLYVDVTLFVTVLPLLLILVHITYLLYIYLFIYLLLSLSSLTHFL